MNQKKISKPKRDPKMFIRFLAIAVVLMLILDFVFFKEGRPYLYGDKLALDSGVPTIPTVLEEPIVVKPPVGEYFEAPIEETSSDEGPDFVDYILDLYEEDEEILESEVLLIPEIPEVKSKENNPVVIPPPLKEETKLIGNKRGKIAIVIDDMGMNLSQSRAAINLPSEVTLAFLPYAEQVKALSDEANRQGHEIIIHAPMEAMSSDVPLGPMALMSHMDFAQFSSEFNKIADSFNGYVGLNNHMGSRLTQSKEHMAYLMDNLKPKNMYFLDSRTIHTSVAAEMAALYGVPTVTRDIFLDHEATEEYTAEALARLERMALENGSAVAIGHPKEITIKALEAWIPTMREKGLELVKVSELLQ